MTCWLYPLVSMPIVQLPLGVSPCPEGPTARGYGEDPLFILEYRGYIGILGTILGYMGGCQNCGPFLGTLNIRGRITIGTQKGTIILTTNHIRIMENQMETTILANPTEQFVRASSLQLHLLIRVASNIL